MFTKPFLIQHGKSLQENEICGRWMLNIKSILLKGLVSQVVLCRQDKSLFSDVFALKRAFILPLIEVSLVMWDFKNTICVQPTNGFIKLESDFTCFVLIPCMVGIQIPFIFCFYRTLANACNNLRCLYEFISFGLRLQKKPSKSLINGLKGCS